MDERRRLLDEAAKVITGDRNKTHGDYGLEARRIARAWSVLVGNDVEVKPETVPLMMIALKLCRASAGTINRDDFVDIAGYAALAYQMNVDREGDK
jgi:hypothetical protein